MKHTIKLISAVATLTAMMTAVSCNKSDSHAGHDHPHGEHGDHDHDHSNTDKKAGDGGGESHADCVTKLGPNQGRLISGLSPSTEFLVKADGSISLKFFNEKNEEIDAELDQIKFHLDSDPITLTKDGKGYKSEIISTKLPAKASVTLYKGDDRQSHLPFDLILDECDKCKKKEYTCTCHKHDHDHDHDHGDHKH